jgi:hypothetical protein
VNCYSIFPHDSFYDFFQNYLCQFFFNIKLIKNYNYNKTKSYGKALLFSSQNTVDCYSISLNGFFIIFSKIVFVDFIRKSTVDFLTKHCQLLQRFSSWVFSFQNYLCRFIFNIKLVDNLVL